MAKRRRLKTEVVRRVVLEARYEPGDGWPSDAALSDDLKAVLAGDIVEAETVDGLAVVGIETTTERVPIEEPQG